MLIRLEKLRRFFYFVDAILKKMPNIKKAFQCFRIIINGKLAGGTKRTKSMSIGFGRYPMQTLGVNVTNNYMNFTHRFGEFGIHFVM
jgi:ribosomal protein S3